METDPAKQKELYAQLNDVLLEQCFLMPIMSVIPAVLTSSRVQGVSERYRVLAYDSVNYGLSSNSRRGEAEPDRADELVPSSRYEVIEATAHSAHCERFDEYCAIANRFPGPLGARTIRRGGWRGRAGSLRLDSGSGYEIAEHFIPAIFESMSKQRH
ncbi:MAG: hypothetical protein JOZ65_07075, partial [Chloroflexi bacterium]|nr:hypothetical protein [Chloroflexota bacterium]